MIKDPYGRPLRSIRISITQRCDLHCFYCHREGENKSGYIEMMPDEIQRIVNVAASFNVRKVKLTGGEPLLRSDVLEIVERIKKLPTISEVSMTTNGILLSALAGPLKDAGLTRVNVSLDTLDKKTYKLITGADRLEMVIRGIKRAVEVGLSPVKINMVVLKGVNESQVWEIVDFAKELGLILQLIELESATEDEFYQKYHTNLSQIEKELGMKAEKTIIRNMNHRRKYFLMGGGEVEVVKPMHNTEFCKYCSRLRVTSDGKFKPCLFRTDNLIDFLGSIRNNVSDEALKKIFVKAVNNRMPYFA